MQKVILSLALGFIFGVAFSGIENSIFLILCGFAISFLVFIYCRLFETGGVRELGLLVSIFLIAFSFGQIRFLVFEKNISKDLSFYENKKVDFTGIVFKESQSDGLRQKVFVDVKRIKTVGGYKDVNSKIIVFTSLYPKFSYGDNVSGSGKITKPEKIESDTGLYFDYPKYLAKDKITHLIYFGSLETLSFGGGNFFTRKLISLKNIFIGSVSKTLKEPELSLAAGIIFGSQNTSKDLVNVFRISGLSHITVLSGYNITIVAENILKILLPISRFANIFSIVSIFLFIVLSGASSTSIRAGIMASLAILGRRFGKTYSAGRALFFALFLMVLWNPFILLYDPSFHLSFPSKENEPPNRPLELGAAFPLIVPFITPR
jgi:competence protein ComEC